KQLVVHYAARQQLDEAERELRAIAAATPDDVGAELDLVRFLRLVKGPAAARQELLTRTNTEGEAFPYQMALAEFDLAQGNVIESIQLLEKVISAGSSREHVVAAQTKLAEIHLSRKNLDVAESLVTKILRSDGRNTDGLRLRAVIRLERGQLDAAITDV